MRGQNEVKGHCTQTVAGVKGLWRPRYGMWPLSKKAKPGSSSNRKGFFGRNG